MWEDMVVLLRRTRMTGPQIARSLRLPASTVARVLKRQGLSRLREPQYWNLALNQFAIMFEGRLPA